MFSSQYFARACQSEIHTDIVCVIAWDALNNILFDRSCFQYSMAINKFLKKSRKRARETWEKWNPSRNVVRISWIMTSTCLTHSPLMCLSKLCKFFLRSIDLENELKLTSITEFRWDFQILILKREISKSTRWKKIFLFKLKKNTWKSSVKLWALNVFTQESR